MAEPVLGKAEPSSRWDYKLVMDWNTFLNVKGWAQQVANNENAPVYLVGSILAKDNPRDLDVSVVFPVKVFEDRFGKIPENGGTSEMHEYMRRLRESSIQHYISGMDAIKWITRLDIKFCPDTWWTKKDKLLIASPTDGGLEG